MVVYASSKSSVLEGFHQVFWFELSVVAKLVQSV
jgi:hypothetical protein